MDTAALELYTGKVSGLFEGVASSLGDDMRALSGHTSEQLATLRTELSRLGTGKADASAVQSLEEAMAREDEAMRLLAGQVGGGGRCQQNVQVCGDGLTEHAGLWVCCVRSIQVPGVLVEGRAECTCVGQQMVHVDAVNIWLRVPAMYATPTCMFAPASMGPICHPRPTLRPGP